MSKVVPLEGFGGGASSPLNFKIVAYATEEELVAAQPKENTIGVVTTTPINGWVFSSEEPTENLVDGLIWIQTDSSSDIAFNALKKNSMMVYPSISYQYLSGSWNELTAKSYLNNSWVDWYVWDGTLYNAGDEYENITGGWVAVAFAGGAADYGITGGAPTVTKGTSSMTVKMSSTQRAGVARTANLIDLTNYSTLSVTVTSRASGSSSGTYIYIIDANGNYPAAQEISSTGTKTLSVSNLNGSYYVGIYVFNYNSSTKPTVTFTNVKLS